MARLLIVDDDMDIAEALADALACDGHDVRTARDGVEGLARLTDIHDAGLEAIPILLLSTNADLPRIAARVGTPYFLGRLP